MSSSGYVGFILRFTATIIIPKTNQVVFAIGHLFRNADLITVEVEGLLAFTFFVGPVVYLCQGFVRTAHALRQDCRFYADYGLLIIA